jgi:hypothetical protein
MVFGFPDKLITQLRYHTSQTLTSVLGGVGPYSFRWNSIFDPDLTGAGHQPLYRDTFAAIYDQYAVISAKARIRFTNYSNDDWYVGCVTDDDATPSTNVDTLSEQNHSYSRSLGLATGGNNIATFYPIWNCVDVLSIDPFTSLGYKTAVGANPTEQSVLSLFAFDKQSPATANINVDVLLEFEVLWTELTTPSQS